MKKAMALGNYVDAKYHPFTEVDQELQSILHEEIRVECTDNYSVLNEATLSNYELFISYTEFMDEEITEEQTDALIHYVKNGGGLLVIHNGISLQRSPRLAELIGGRFTGHPEYTELPVIIKEGSHPIVEGFESFTIDEEPYRFDLQLHDDTIIFAEYEHDQERWPAAWAHEYGQGRVVYLMPGHHLPSFHVGSYRELILRSARWAAKLESASTIS
ncbi:ThuA domain-containing protein [Neobacillus mesonae]|nr:ThuA domain-containing protein [Neobacillus mesonae]